MQSSGFQPLTEVEELERFLNEGRCLKLHDDVFEWWHKNKFVFPCLHKLAMQHLIVPATSADSERVFSTTGNVLSARRSRLTGIHANMIIFLNSYLKSI